MTIFRYQPWYNDKGENVMELELRDPLAETKLPRFKTELTLTVGTPQGQMPVWKEQFPIEAESVEEAFEKIPELAKTSLPVMAKKFEAHMAEQNKPKIEVPGGFIANQNGHHPGANGGLRIAR
jgi:hypothetical protein